MFMSCLVSRSNLEGYSVLLAEWMDGLKWVCRRKLLTGSSKGLTHEGRVLLLHA